MNALLDFCQAARPWMIDTLGHLVSIESPSTDKAAVDRCGGALSALLEQHGARVTRLPRPDAGDHVLAEFGCGQRQVLLLGHFDTVWPVGQLGRMPIKVDEERFYGPGSLDMKAGLVIALLAARAITELDLVAGTRTVLLLTSDEETGSHTSREAVEEEARRSDAVLVLEPGLADGSVKTGRKGVGEFTIDVDGVAAHAGVDPGGGASAVREMARQVIALDGMASPERGLSVNVGVVEGGTRSNVVAAHARARVDVRVTSMDDVAHIERAIRQLRPFDDRTTIRVSGGINRPPMERTPGVARLFELARDVAAGFGVTLTEGSTGGASDGNFTAALGVPTLDGLGGIGEGAHALHEHVEIESLPVRAALLAGLVQRIDWGPTRGSLPRQAPRDGEASGSTPTARR